MRGRLPKPKELRILNGNAGHRAINTMEPKFSGTPECPSFLTQVAKEEWRRIVNELEALNMLRSVDQAVLSAYCQSLSRWIEAEETVTREGQTLKEPIMTKTGDCVGYKVKRHPATVIANAEKAAMVSYAAQFGFSPSSRTRVQVGEPKASDPFADFLAAIPQVSNEADSHTESGNLPN